MRKKRVYDVEYLVSSAIISIGIVVYGIYDLITDGWFIDDCFNYMPIVIILLGLLLLVFSLKVNIVRE